MQLFGSKTRSSRYADWVTALVVGLVCSLQTATADIFHLRTGGQLTGYVVKRVDNGDYLVKSDNGAVVTLSRRQIAKVVSQDDTDLLYQARSRATPDTVGGHRELADWCKANRRTKLAKQHLQRVIELDPQDEHARRSLGYQQHRGQWLNRTELMASRGMHKYDGDYRTPQDIALRERTKLREKTETDWFLSLRTWVGWLNKRRSAEAVDNITRITDPRAAPAIVKLLDREDDPRVRNLLIQTLAALNSPMSVTTLVDFSINDPDREVRLQCLDFLMRYHQPINLEPYVQALNDRKYSNDIINRAAVALGEIGNPDAMSPLIDALITTHTFRNVNAAPGNINPTFGSAPGGGGGGLSMGGESNKLINRNLQNLSVRQALVELSRGQDFGFDEKTWRAWFVNKQIPDDVDTRRDR